jgi:nucleotide-binding universal stress UspA family protein
MFRKILIATDGSGASNRAIEVGANLAAGSDADVIIVHAIDLGAAVVPEFGIIDKRELDEAQRAGQQLLRAAAARAASAPRVETILLHGRPADAILAAAKTLGVDLLMLGADGRGRLAHLLLGSTAEAVIRHAPCAVLSVPRVVALPDDTEESNERFTCNISQPLN